MSEDSSVTIALPAMQEMAGDNQAMQMQLLKLTDRFDQRAVACGPWLLGTVTQLLRFRKWEDETRVSECPACERAFTVSRRKHHCRHCGLVLAV